MIPPLKIPEARPSLAARSVSAGGWGFEVWTGRELWCTRFVHVMRHTIVAAGNVDPGPSVVNRRGPPGAERAPRLPPLQDHLDASRVRLEK